MWKSDDNDKYLMIKKRKGRDQRPTKAEVILNDAKDFSGALLDGIQAGNMDVNTALGLLGSRVQPGSSFYKSQAFDNLINYQMSEDDSKNLIGDAFNTNYFRSGSIDEINALYDQAANAGVLNNPN